MSVKVMSLVWDHYPNGGGELLLALALADWASHDGAGIWASVDSMAEKSRQSERNVQYHLSRMRNSGWLILTAPEGEEHRTRTYRIPVERIPAGTIGRVQTLHPPQDVGVKPIAPMGCKIEQKGVKPIAPEPSLTVKEPSLFTSGEPDTQIPTKVNGHSATAKELLAFLNEKTGRRYQPVPANLEMIVARLKDGATIEEMRMVVAKKCREWSGDEKMAMYLRPATLFNRTKYAQYQGELGAMS